MENNTPKLKRLFWQHHFRRQKSQILQQQFFAKMTVFEFRLFTFTFLTPQNNPSAMTD
jgi:hypothetical protein